MAEAAASRPVPNKLDAAAVPLTKAELQNKVTAELFISNVSSTIGGVLQCQAGLTSNTGDNQAKCALAANYLKRCVMAGDVPGIRKAVVQKKYENRGDLIWSLIKDLLPISGEDFDEWSTILTYLGKPRQGKEDLTLKLWKLSINTAIDRMAELADGDEVKTRQLLTEAAVLRNLVHWETPKDRALPDWCDNFMVIKLRSADVATIDNAFAELAAFEKVVDGDQPDRVSAVPSTTGRGPADACHKHPKCRPPHTNAECKAQHPELDSGASKRKPKPASKPDERTRGECFNWLNHGKCSRSNCPFVHDPDKKGSGKRAKPTVAKVTTGAANSIDPATGEPEQCATCHSQFHSSASCPKRGEGQIARIEGAVLELSNQLAFMAARVADGGTIASIAPAQQGAVPRTVTHAPPPQTVPTRSLEQALAQSLAATQRLQGVTSANPCTPSQIQEFEDPTFDDLSTSTGSSSVRAFTPSWVQSDLDRVSEVTVHAKCDTATHGKRALFDSGAGIPITGKPQLFKRIEWYDTPRRVNLGDENHSTFQLGRGVMEGWVWHDWIPSLGKGGWALMEEWGRIGPEFDDPILCAHGFKTGHGYRYANEDADGHLKMVATDGSVLKARDHGSQLFLEVKWNTFEPNIPTRYQRFFKMPTVAAVAGADPFPQTSLHEGFAEGLERAVADLDREFTEQNAENDDVEPNVIAIAPSGAYTLSSTGDAPDMVQAMVKENPFKKGDSVLVTWPSGTFSGTVTAANRRYASVEFTDGSVTTVYRPFTAMKFNVSTATGAPHVRC